MIRLDTISRTIQLTLGAFATTNQLPIIVCYSDKSVAQYNGATQLTISSNTTPVNICNSPAASIVRDIDSVSIYNADTVSAVVNVSYNDNGTLYPISKAILNPGDSLRYTHSDGWSAVDVTGSVKTSANANLATIALYAVEQYADSAGTSDALTANYSNASPTLTDGYRLTLGIAAFNATPTPTFAPTLGGVLQTARLIHKFTGNVSVPLAIGDLQGDADLRYDLPNTLWILMNPAAANGATGGAGNPVFYENASIVTANYTITTGNNAMTAGPVTINAGIVVTVPAGSTWSIV